ncbi:MAG: ABC transporter ATP-binding protein [Acidiferrobacterales bacterium]|nr:ABC transporter ATP-binding protein [Acidiferrobacterales bacterium]
MNESTENSPIVVLKDVSKSFLEGDNHRSVLADINARFRRGGIHAVVGRSGSGKSTLLNLIAGVDLPDSGTIEINGCAINESTEHQRTLLRRETIGFIFQFFNLIPSLTVQENVQLPLDLAGMDSRQDRVMHILDRVGLRDRADDYPQVLSGGERQRVAIARAVVHEPELLLADEPTGNLDYDSASQVLEALRYTAHQRTVIVVTHSREIASQADEVWPLRFGSFDHPDPQS